MDRILVVDDLALIRIPISRKLTEEGFECMAASRGDDALRLLKQHHFSLALLDITMPGKSGIEVLREITLRYPDTAVIMITASDDAETAIETMKMGAYDYMIKPLNLVELLLRVRRALDKRTLIIENKEYKDGLENKIRQQTQKIQESFLNSLKSLALALEAKDKYTSGHSQRVANLAVETAREIGLAPEQVEKLKFAALVHDIGKIGIRETVINKENNLTDEEFSYISTHAVTGQKILTPVVDDVEILEMVRHHHERYDGSGYPDGISAEKIPLGARVIAVADMYDAMTSDRPYRKAVSHEMAIGELQRQSLEQFDPMIVKAFIGMMSKRGSISPVVPTITQ